MGQAALAHWLPETHPTRWVAQYPPSGARIDAVEKYRQYDTDGNALKGIYAHIFEEEFRRLAIMFRVKHLWINSPGALDYVS
jgi:hypothetical protein